MLRRMENIQNFNREFPHSIEIFVYMSVVVVALE